MRAPDLDMIAGLATDALDALPTPLRAHTKSLSIRVEEAPDAETLAALGLESEWELTGLYQGTPLGQKDAGGTPTLPDTVLLYRQPILLEWIETDVTLAQLVRNVLIHEIGHHFGFSDDDIDRLEQE